MLLDFNETKDNNAKKTSYLNQIRIENVDQWNPRNEFQQCAQRRLNQCRYIKIQKKNNNNNNNKFQ